MDFSPLTYAVFTGAVTAAMAAGAVKASLNGAKAAIKETREMLHNHIKEESNADSQTHERLTRVETRLDMLLDRIK